MSDNPFPTPALMLVTGRECIAGSTDPFERLENVVVEAVRGGVSVVQLREKHLSDGQILRLLMKLQESLPPHIPVILNSSSLSPQAAKNLQPMLPSTHPLIHPQIIHLPEHAPRPPNGIAFGRSVHSVEAACHAEQEGARYLVAGSIFPTSSHPGGAVKGLPFLEEVCKNVLIPVLAIGGILPERVEACLERGAAGVAVRSSILSAASPQVEAARFRAALTGHRDTMLQTPSPAG